MAGRRIGFVSTRLAGTDGVTLEARKWAEVLTQDGHRCFFMAGELDCPEDVAFLVPNCHFINGTIWSLYEGCFDRRTRARETTVRIDAVKRELKDALYAFVDRFGIELLIPENANAIPYNIPLGLAITEFVMETGIKVIAHHHDFFWERKRFLTNACWDYLSKAFPPNLFTMSHVVLNSSQRHQLSLRRGISAETVPNMMDFDTEPATADGYATDLRAALGIAPDEVFVLQPTRIVQRKGIEHAIEFVHRLGRPAVLVISHAAGDEGDHYYRRILEYSELLNVKTVYCAGNVGHARGTLPDGRKVYSLADLYAVADLVTYPSEFEGFGNAFLEAIYYRRPIVVNNYTVYNYDIKPKGFKTVEMDGYVNADTIRSAQAILDNPAAREAMVDHNRELAKHHFSYRVLRQKLRTLMIDCFGS
jgi:mannosylglucosylglycerate synthase